MIDNQEIDGLWRHRNYLLDRLKRGQLEDMEIFYRTSVFTSMSGVDNNPFNQ